MKKKKNIYDNINKNLLMQKYIEKNFNKEKLEDDDIDNVLLQKVNEKYKNTLTSKKITLYIKKFTVFCQLS